MQSWYDGSSQHYYRWDLDKIIAPNENAGYFNIIQVSYLQDCVNGSGQSVSCSSTTTVRDAAMEQISYGYSVPSNLHAAARTFANTILGTTVGQVDFSYYAPFNDTSNGITFATTYPYSGSYTCKPPVSTSLRCDDPVAYQSEPAPTVMSTLSLQGITSYVGTDTTGNKAYGYQLGYQDSPFTTTLPTPGGSTMTCEDPNSQNQEYCAGEHLLTSITPIVYQSGSGHQLPPVTFGYNDPVNAPMINTYYDTQNKLGTSNYSVETAWQYLTSYLDSDTGVGASITYNTAYANTHGTPYYYNNNNKLVDDRHDPLYCSLHGNDPSNYNSQCISAYAHPDDRAWSQQVVTVLTSSGTDSSAKHLKSIFSYAYTLKVTNPNGSKTCTAGTLAGPGQGPTPPGNSDCVGDNWFAPSDGDWIDYYHSEYRGFAVVDTVSGGNLYNNAGDNLTVDSYESTEGWQTPASDPANFLAGQLDEEDVYEGTANTGNPLLSVVNTYATASGIAAPCRDAAHTNSTYTPCEVVLLSMRTTQYEGKSIGNSSAPWVENDYTYDDYSIEYGLSAPNNTFTAYHNLTQEVTSSSNAQSVTNMWSYTPQESLGSSWSYYDVNKVTHSEVDDSNNHVWLCQDTTYDEGAPSGVPVPNAGWPTTIKAYSNCGAQSGGVTSYLGYDPFGNLVATVDPLGKAQSGLYSSNGCTVSSGALAATPSIFTSNWSQSSYTSCTLYDSNHVLPVQTTDAFGYFSTITYDPAQGDLPTSSNDLNAQTTSTSYTYDGSSGSNGKVTVDTILPLEAQGKAYTQQSNTVSNCAGGSATPCFKIASNSQQYQNAVSHTYYDSLGRMVEVTKPVPEPVNGQSGQSYIEVVFTVYNDQTNSVATSVPFITQAPSNSTGWVDPNGAQDYQQQAPGLYVTYFDALGRPIAAMDPYFNANNPTGVTCPGGSAATSCAFYGFDSPQGSSNIFDYTAMLDPNNHVSVSFSDSLGNVRFVQNYSQQYVGPSGIDSISANLNEQEKIAYNALSEPTSVTDTDQNSPTGQNQSVTASASYDDLGRLSSVTDPDRGNHSYSYDQDGNVINDTSGTRSIGYNYDLLGRLGCVNDAASSTINATGSCTSGSNPYLQFVYDTDKLGSKSQGTDFPTGRMTQSKATTYFPDGTSATTTEQMQYDARGRVIKGRMLLTVPSSWEVASQLPSYYQLQPSYNDADQVQYVTTSTSTGGQGYTASNDYDSATGVLIGVGNDTTQSPNLAKVLYNNNAGLDTIDYKTNSSGSGFLATEQFSYDADLRPTNASASRQAASGNNGTIFSQSPQYDLASNVISLSTTQATVLGQSSSGGSETQDFCYDEQNRLVWAGNSGSEPSAGSGTCGSAALSTSGSLGSYHESYSYTHLGQLWQVNGGGSHVQYLYCNSNAPHQLTAIVPQSSGSCSNQSGATYTSSDDAWGNVTSRTSGSSTATLSYDLLDHFVHWNAGSSSREWYVYDASGNRVLRRSISSTGTSVTVYAFGLEEHTYTFDSSGNPTGQNQTYYYSLGGSLLGALEVNGSTSSTNYFLTDALGSVLATISNTAGSASVVGNQLYDPYGNSRYQAGSLTTSKGFTGQYNDNLTGLDDYGSRYYDPTAGVFLSADPLVGDLAGANPYEYVGANPETNTDPSGERFISGSGQQGPLGPINVDNVPPPTVGSDPGFFGQLQETSNLNLQPDACTAAGCKSVAAAVVNEVVPGSGSASSTGGRQICLAGGGSTLSSMGGVLVASPGVGGCVSDGGSQSSSGTPAQVIQHLLPYTLCTLGFDCSDENGGKDQSSGGGEGREGGDLLAAASGDGGLPPPQDELAQGREELGMLPRSVNPDDKQTFAILKADDKEYWGINGRKPIAIQVNAISRDHAEIDALNQLFLDRKASGIRGGSAVLLVDRPPCPACGTNGGIRSGVRAAWLDELKVIFGPGLDSGGNLIPAGEMNILP